MRHKKNTGQSLALVMAFGLALAVLLFGGPLLQSITPAGGIPPFIDRLTTRLALFSAGMGMPEGTLILLERRFGADASSSTPPPAPPPKQEDPGDEDSSSSLPEPKPPGEIPEVDPEHRGTLLEEDMSGHGSNIAHPIGAGHLRNYTNLTLGAIDKELGKDLKMQPKLDGSPQVLIIHTHATEAYEPYDAPYFDTRQSWRDTNNENNMVVVGAEIARILEEAGIGVLHDTTQHDYPSYNGAYERSAVTVKNYLKEYPSIKIVLDVHRDAIQRADDLIVKPTVVVDGRKAAQLMIITGCDDGTMNVPKWADNLRFAAAVTNAVEEDTPGLMRPIFFCYRKYNMDLTQGSILLEFGSHGNTLEEATYTATLFAQSFARLLTQLAKG